MLSYRKKQVITIGLLIATVLGILFATRFVVLFNHFGPPPNKLQLSDPDLVRGWMSVEYISAAYKIPLDLFRTELQLKPGQEKIPLRALDRESKTSQTITLVERVQSIISKHNMIQDLNLEGPQ